MHAVDLKSLRLIILLLVIFVNIQVCLPQENEDLIVASQTGEIAIYFTFVNAGIPYIYIEDESIINNVKGNIESKNIEIDPEKTIIKVNLPFFNGGNLEEQFPVNELKSNNDFLQDLLGIKKGDKYIIQQATDPNTANQQVVSVENYFLHTSRKASFILLECSPTGYANRPVKLRYDDANIFIAYPYKEWDREGAYNSVFDMTVPAAILDTLQKIEDVFVPESWKNPWNDPVLGGDARNGRFHFSTTSAPLRIINPDGQEELYYCGNVSYGLKGNNGHLYLIDKDGVFVQDLTTADTGSDRDYTRIVGITDINRDRTHEIVTYWGDAYGGGYAVLTVEFDTFGNPFLVQILSLLTIRG